MVHVIHDMIYTVHDTPLRHATHDIVRARTITNTKHSHTYERKHSHTQAHSLTHHTLANTSLTHSLTHSLITYALATSLTH